MRPTRKDAWSPPTKESNAGQYALTCSAGPLTQNATQVLGFDPIQTAYGVNSSRTAVTVTPTSEDETATIRVRFGSGSDDVAASGTASKAGQLQGRSGTFYITVGRSNTTKVYSVAAYRIGLLRSLMRVIFSLLWPFPKALTRMTRARSPCVGLDSDLVTASQRAAICLGSAGSSERPN